MVLSAAVAFVILPIMCWLRRENWNQRLTVLFASVVIAIDVYFITNPYVLIHLLHDRTVLLSNLRNSQAMYQAPVSIGGLANGLKLLATGAGVFIFGVLAVGRIRAHAALQLLDVVAALVLVQFFLLATGKPAEYARFAIVADIALLVTAFAGATKFDVRRACAISVIAFLLNAILGLSYVWHFLDDATSRTPRVIAAERMQKLAPSSIAIAAEPAPYCTPPVNLFTTRLLLHSADADLAIRTVDQVGGTSEAEYWSRPRLLATPMSWAHKPFEVRINKPAKPATVPSAH
jgi:hypothetical protein